MAAKDSPLEVLVPLKSWEDAVSESQSLEAQLAAMTLRAEAAERDLRHMHETLTHAQRRSTECLEIARAVKVIGDDPIMQRLAPLGAATLRDEEKRPFGHGLQLLVATMGRVGAELASDPDDKRDDRVRAAMLDLATAATRAWLFLGDS